jgi:hypothetical protein
MSDAWAQDHVKGETGLWDVAHSTPSTLTGRSPYDRSVLSLLEERVSTLTNIVQNIADHLGVQVNVVGEVSSTLDNYTRVSEIPSASRHLYRPISQFTRADKQGTSAAIRSKSRLLHEEYIIWKESRPEDFDWARLLGLSGADSTNISSGDETYYLNYETYIMGRWYSSQDVTPTIERMVKGCREEKKSRGTTQSINI